MHCLICGTPTITELCGDHLEDFNNNYLYLREPSKELFRVNRTSYNLLVARPVAKDDFLIEVAAGTIEKIKEKLDFVKESKHIPF